MVSSTVSSMLPFLILLFLAFPHMDEALGEQTQLDKLKETNYPDQLMVQRRVLGVSSGIFADILQGYKFLENWKPKLKQFQYNLSKPKIMTNMELLKTYKLLFKYSEEELMKTAKLVKELQDRVDGLLRRIPPPPGH